jgi:hypothetical protein
MAQTELKSECCFCYGIRATCSGKPVLEYITHETAERRYTVSHSHVLKQRSTVLDSCLQVTTRPCMLSLLDFASGCQCSLRRLPKTKSHPAPQCIQTNETKLEVERTLKDGFVFSDVLILFCRHLQNLYKQSGFDTLEVRLIPKPKGFSLYLHVLLHSAPALLLSPSRRSFVLSLWDRLCS